MAIKAAGKLKKLRSALKKINSFGKQKISSTSDCRCNSGTDSNSSIASADRDHDQSGRYAVYVGKSRRQYMISSEVLDHPVFQELKSNSNGTDEISVACEVVLFEHLLWMLENSDSQMDSLDELVPFYTC